MKALSLSIITLAAAGTLVAAPVSAKTTPAAQSYKTAPPATAKQAKVVDDKTLTDRIEAKIKGDASLKKFDVDVSVKDSVATLTGKVRTEAEKVRAGRDAHVPGVSRVDNQIVLDKDAGKGVADKVKETTSTVGQKTKSTAETVGEKTKETAETVGQKTKEGVSKTGEVITDSWITTKVHSRFTGEDLLKGSDINVDTNNHVVTLKGTVKSAAGRARAAEIAKTTDGVTKVVDQLTIK